MQRSVLLLATIWSLGLGPPAAAQGSEAGALTPLEAGIIAEMNLARRDPRTYVSYLEAMLPHFDGTLLRLPGRIPLATIEGAPAVREAIAALRAQARVDSLAV